MSFPATGNAGARLDPIRLRLVDSLAHSNPDIDILSQLMAGPVEPFKGEPAEEVRGIEPPNYKGFSILQDSGILDLRPWNPGDSASPVYGYRHLKVLKNPDNTGTDVFRVVELTTQPDAQFRFRPSPYPPRLRRACGENPGTKEAACQFEVGVDLSKVPTGQVVDVQGTSIGKGFTGTIKRHNFSSQRASHGNSRSHNVPGSISMAQDPGRVFPGKKMTGHMGDETVTTQNLDIVRIDETRQLLLVRGAVPGAKNGHVVVSPAVKARAPKGAAQTAKKGAKLCNSSS